MDTTKENILQCEKAVEVQKLSENDKVLFNIWWHKKGEFIEQSYLKPCDKFGYFIKGIIWLPTQSQLQGMVIFENGNRAGRLCKAFEDWRQEQLNTKDDKYFNVFHLFSMEQLWLAFVQFELYGKIWSENDWVKNG